MNWNGLAVVFVVFVVVGTVVVVVVGAEVVVVGLGPLVGTVGTSGTGVVVVGGGIGVVMTAWGLKPGGSRLDTSSRMTGTAGETRKPSITVTDLEGGGVGVVCSSSAILAACNHQCYSHVGLPVMGISIVSVNLC